MSTTNPYPCVADRPEVLAFVASLPEDPERDRLTADYRRLTAAWLKIGSRAGEITPRVEDIVDGLIDAEGKARTALLAEYVQLGAELELLPKLRSQVARRYAEALNAWAKHVRGQIVRASDDAVAKLNRLTDDLEPHQLKVHRLDQSTRLREDNQADYAQASEAVARICGERQPYHTRHDAAKQVVSFIDLTIARCFGEDARAHGAGQNDVERFVAHVSKQAA